MEVIPLKTKFFAAFLSLIMVFSIFPTEAFSAEDDLTLCFDSYSSPQDSTEPDALFTQYANHALYGSDISPLGTSGGDMLSGNEKILYDSLVPLIRQIACGQRSSTTLSVGRDVTDQNGVFYPADVSVTFPDTEFADDALDRVVAALVSDLPYDLYWYDKVTGCKMFYFRTSKAILQFNLQFHVADNYQGSDIFSVNTAKAGIPASAAAYAAEIVASFSSASDYEKLVGYKNTICELVDYNYDAVNTDFSSEVDPWQIIYVFDRDPTTKVVCEGYAKAFQYLCDLTNFQSDIRCFSIAGYMEGSGHMWNIVSIDGKNYLADVTNSDYGSIGYDEHLFLVGGRGSISKGYLVGDFLYSYEKFCTLLWGSGADSILNISDTAYSPNLESCTHNSSLVNRSEATCTKAGYSGDTVCTYCSAVLAKGQTIPAKGHTWDSGTRVGNLMTFTCRDCRSQYSVDVPEMDPPESNSPETNPPETNPPETEPAEDKPSVSRIFGADRYATAFQAADALRDTLGISKFSSIIVACGTNFPDALAGTYLAARKNAPILLVKGSNVSQVNAYIQANLAPGGTLYLLGDSGVVPNSVGQGISGISIKRLGGATRYDTNLLILKEAGVTDEAIIVCTGQNFADSLSVSAAGLPILLVKDGLTAAQKDFLAATTGEKIIIGGTVAVNTTVEKQLASFGKVARLAGATRYETSILVAKAFFTNSTNAVLAYAQNFPDGLSGGPLAYSLGAPLILTATGKEAAAVSYATKAGIQSGYILGGTGLISDAAANRIFGRDAKETIPLR